MKKYRGLILIILTFVFTYIFWMPEKQASAMASNRQYSQFIASIALVAFAWINYISSRHKLIDMIFNGLDKSYVYHKYLSIISILLIWAHKFTLNIGGGGRQEGFKPVGEGFKRTNEFAGQSGSSLLHMVTNGKQLGSLSLYIFTAFTLFFLITYKLEYEKWKILHKLMIIPYAFGVAHYYLSSSYPVFDLSAFSIWMNIINMIGIMSAIYSICVYEFTAFKYNYKVSKIREIAKNTFEVTGISSGKVMEYTAGQFAFMKVAGRKKGFPSHPFTMSQAQNNSEIQFGIKALGDHTGKLKDNLEVGDTIAVSGPYGRFNYRIEERRQVWIAGGIGITPFRSFLQSDIPSAYNIDFFYAYNNEQDAPYVDELKCIKDRKSVRIHLIDSSTSGFLGIEHIGEYVNKDEQFEAFFCGPKPMRSKLMKELKKENYKVKEFHYEQFQFK